MQKAGLTFDVLMLLMWLLLNSALVATKEILSNFLKTSLPPLEIVL